MNITVTRNEDKKEFENWINDLSDDFFLEVYEIVKKEMPNVNEVYNSEDYNEVITLFKESAKSLAKEKVDEIIKEFESIINF